MPDRQSEIPDQEGHGGLRCARKVEIHFRDASAHQTWPCKWTRDSETLEENPTCLKKAKLETVYQDLGNRSKEIPWTWHQRQLKERVGFLFSLLPKKKVLSAMPNSVLRTESTESLVLRKLWNSLESPCCAVIKKKKKNICYRSLELRQIMEF